MQCFVKLHSKVVKERVKRGGNLGFDLLWGQKGHGTDKNPAVTGTDKEGWSTRLVLHSVEREGPLKDGGPERSCG